MEVKKGEGITNGTLGRRINCWTWSPSCPALGTGTCTCTSSGARCVQRCCVHPIGFQGLGQSVIQRASASGQFLVKFQQCISSRCESYAKYLCTVHVPLSFLLHIKRLQLPLESPTRFVSGSQHCLSLCRSPLSMARPSS